MSENDFNADTDHLSNDTGSEISGADKSGEGENADTATVDKNTLHRGMQLFDWLQCVVFAVLCGILVFVFVGRVIGVDGTSMLPTLHHDDKVVIYNLFYTPKDGDIVIIKTDRFGDTPLVKRVIATAGQTIDINFDTHEVFVDGRLLDEPYINEPTATRINFEGPVTVPPGCIFVMGDNRNASSDSRDNRVGMIDTRDVLGKVLMVLIPGPDNSGSRDWSRFGSAYRKVMGYA